MQLQVVDETLEVTLHCPVHIRIAFILRLIYQIEITTHCPWTSTCLPHLMKLLEEL
jgi:hypothetical protein